MPALHPDVISRSNQQRPAPPAHGRDAVPTDRGSHHRDTNKEIQLLQPVLQTSEAADVSYCRDVREKEELVSSTIEEAANRILVNRRPRLIAVREPMSSSAFSTSVASRSVERLGSEPSLAESSQDARSPVPDDEEGSFSDYTEVTITSDEGDDDDDDAPPRPPASSGVPRPSDESAYTEVTVADELVLPRASKSHSVQHSPDADEGSMPEPPTANVMDERLLQSPLTRILEERKRKGHAPWKPRHITFVPNADQHEVTIEAMLNDQRNGESTTLFTPPPLWGPTKSTDTVGTLPLSPGSSFEVAVDAPPPQAEASKKMGRSGWKAHRIPDGAQAPPPAPSFPSGPTMALLSTPKHANRKTRTAWENPPHHPFLLAPATKDPTHGKENSTVKNKKVDASHGIVRTPRPPLHSTMALPGEAAATSMPQGTSQAVWEPRSRSANNSRPVVLASTTEIRPSHRPRTVVVAHHPPERASHRTRSTSRSRSGGRRNAPIYEYGEYHEEEDDEDDGVCDDARTVVSALTLDKKAYHVESPLLIDTDAILDMLESTASTTAASTSSGSDGGGSDSSLGSTGPGRRHNRRRSSSSSKPKSRTLAQSLGLVPRSRDRSKKASERRHGSSAARKPPTPKPASSKGRSTAEF